MWHLNNIYVSELYLFSEDRQSYKIYRNQGDVVVANVIAIDVNYIYLRFLLLIFLILFRSQVTMGENYIMEEYKQKLPAIFRQILLLFKDAPTCNSWVSEKLMEVFCKDICRYMFILSLYLLFLTLGFVDIVV